MYLFTGQLNIGVIIVSSYMYPRLLFLHKIDADSGNDKLAFVFFAIS